MVAAGFVRWELRTIDIEAARSFYGDLLEEGAPDVSELPALARARGARPNWLGHLGVDDPRAVQAAFVARGAVALGNGSFIRDPSGAMLALTSLRDVTRDDVVWSQLLTRDVPRATRDYAELAAMKLGPRVEVEAHGAFDQFAWGNGPWVGSVGDITAQPAIHPQWLFFFRVPDLDRAMTQVRDRGGVAMGSTALPDGRRVAVCDDDQGAAFGLLQTP